ncbi:MAG: Crp/Fnr family transcriptional regulator [candidate division NC10 bacterium]|nr:Crp/Fnr family transcriptional regulator [candidate division NC10 bacterium]MBI2563935.1 Crp/Fnr family transcriptional regulator [candidate division NC10 bacterium]
MTRRTKVSIGDQGIPLEANRLFEGLSAEERDRAIASCVRKRFARGERVFSTGDRPEFLYLLEVGHVQLVALEESGAERILHVFRPGDVFGEILLSVERRPFDAVAVDEAWVAIMSRATFLELLHTSPLCGLNFIRLISDRLFTAERDLAALSRTWTRPRLVHLLLKLADNLGQPTPQGTLITVPVTHETMASMIGASRVRVTSYLNLLRRDGLLSKQGRLMVIRTEGLKGWLGRKGD